MRRSSPKSTPTITDIARKLGVSAMTVSRALTGKSDVSALMREKVLRCAETLGYQPNRWARSLVTQQSNLIGVVLPEISHSFFADLISGVEEVLDHANYDLLLCHSRNDPARERAEIQTLVGSHIDGLIVAPVQPLKSPDLFVDLQKRHVPFVLVDRFFPNFEFSSVRLDDLAAGRLATEFLIDLGHRRIAHIGGPAVSNGQLRRRGYLVAMRARRLPVDPQWTIRTTFDIEAGRHATHKLFERQISPTAIFAANDPLAIGAIYACREAGLRVPEDISIIGAGNIEGPFHPNPFLSTVDWPRQELGRIAARFVLDDLSHGNGPEPRTHVFEPAILARHSTRSIK